MAALGLAYKTKQDFSSLNLEIRKLAEGVETLVAKSREQLPVVDESPANPDVTVSEELAAARMAQVDSAQARTMIEHLAEKNDKLLEEKLDLEKQIDRLSSSLAKAQLRLDSFQSDLRKKAYGNGLPVAETSNEQMVAEVVDFNPELNMVVLGAGTTQGLRVGMLMGILHEDEVIGKIEIIDVRDTVSGGKVIEKLEEWPVLGDRAVPWKKNHGS